MRITRRRILAAGLGLALGSGCHMLPLMGPEPKLPASLKRIASDDKDKVVKLVIVAYGGLEVRPELLQADRQLTELVAKHLRDLCEYNRERITIVLPRKVEEYKNDHPNWHQNLEPAEIGRHFRADFVIFLDINHLSLYEKNSVNQMYRGQADITVSLVDVKKKDDYPERKEFAYTFPGEARGPVPVGDVTLQQFRQSFFDSMGRRLAWFFTAHPMDRQFEMD